jgi:hypothetical protein
LQEQEDEQLAEPSEIQLDDPILDDLELEEREEQDYKIKMWHVFKCVLFKSRHLFEVELAKYKSIIDKRCFFGQEDIEPLILIGKRGLLQNRKRNSQNGNKSLTATESDVDRFYKKMKDHNIHIKIARSKFMTTYFEKYPEKFEEMLKEEKEKQKLRISEHLKPKELISKPPLKPVSSVDKKNRIDSKP